ncbi:MAG: uroporphyrinogen-III C-methyltransferase [Candidatus Schekmanbacteria bacterium RBG_13_48_7]|uniref:uroporphyrinogen-III C-methyltransferase n=1 Tax=Candidatus Schekmanbacteria bacterium RBG_13_48_7 TaxID=1817878 RepID=A0A1F7RQH8_9BACT|nr:MAG: uroporphyrinogen-III C-methyltransferase [Candidatus Schekmanbacteria bacterium RBG_13_48_7]
MKSSKFNTGKVYLVGAGPGDPDLITVKGKNILLSAEVVVYDRLVSEEIYRMAPGTAELIYVGKQPDHHARSQEEINEILVLKAKEGKIVIRLKGGDPFIFGRGGEEALFLSQSGIPFEIVPGITSGIAAPAYAGIPLTHRDWTSSVAFITGHNAPGKDHDVPDWKKIGDCIGTIVVYMAFKNLNEIVDKILESGRSPDTSAAAIYRGTTASQKTVVANLKHIAEKVKKAGLEPPIILVIGEVVNLNESLHWFEP